MRFEPTEINGAYIVKMEPHEDSRGFFGRTFCAREFAGQGLVSAFVQSSISFNRKPGTIRGMHFQVVPACEAKLVRCTAGALYDVIVDMRPDSATYLQHLGVELTSKNRLALYVPQMVAHGFQTLEGDTEVFYQISEYFAPELARGVRVDDPKLGIHWPLPFELMSEKDRGWPLLR